MKLSTRAGSWGGFFGGILTTVPPFEVAGAGACAGARTGAGAAGGGFGFTSVGFLGAVVSGSARTACNFTSKTAGTDARLTSGGFLVSCIPVNPWRG